MAGRFAPTAPAAPDGLDLPEGAEVAREVVLRAAERRERACQDRDGREPQALGFELSDREVPDRTSLLDRSVTSQPPYRILLA